MSAGIFAAITIVALAPSLPAGAERSYVTGNFSMTLEGANVGFLKSVDGGAISAEVVTEDRGPGAFPKKHLGPPRYEDFIIETSLGNKEIIDWIAQSWSKPGLRKSGSIITADRDLTPKSERQFTEAILTETVIAVMDASSKEPGYLTVRFAPEMIRSVAPAGGKLSGDLGAKQKQWNPSNFKLEIDGIDCSRVARIEPLAVKLKLTSTDMGNAKISQKEAAKLEFPDLMVTIAQADAKPFLDWHEDFVVKGNCDESKEKGGTLTLLGPNRTEVLARIRFYNLGIRAIRPAKLEANADAIARVRAEMYVERMEFLPGGAEPAKSEPAAPAAPVAPLPPKAPRLPGAR